MAAVAQAGLFPNLPKANLSRGSFFLQARRFLRNAEFPADGLRGAGAFFVFRVLAKPILRGIGGRRSIAACAVRPFWAVADF